MKMRTTTGREFDPTSVTMNDLSIHDIAHALSHLCRYGGHLPRFYSVAQHSVYAANYASVRNFGSHVELQCLLHDASEAYLGDIIRPLKVALPEYREIEERVQRVIFERYCDPAQPIYETLIHEADEWVLQMEFVVFRDFADGWEPARARQEFMTTFERLRGSNAAV